jgi:hypothetical protein
MICITIVSLSMLMNGYASTLFKLGRGLKQGCHLSPLRFLIIFKGLRGALIEAKRTSSLRGICICTSLNISHLLFVDGISLFCDETRRDVPKFKEILDLCCTSMRMMTTLGKFIVSF